MKRLLFLILLLSLSVFAFAATDTLEGEELTDAATIEGVSTTDTVEGQVLKAAASGDCPSGTYTQSLDFDHSSGNDYVCVSGDTDIDAGTTGGTIHSDYGNTGNGYRITANNQHVTWAATFNTVGTVWLQVKPVSTTRSASIRVWEFTQSTDNDNHVRIVIGTSGEVYGYWEGNNTLDFATSGANIADSSFSNVGFAWSLAGDKLSTSTDGGSSWTEETSEGLQAMAQTINEMSLGEYRTGGTFTETADLDDFAYIAGSYQAACPF